MNCGLLTKRAGWIEPRKCVNGYTIIGPKYEVGPIARLIFAICNVRAYLQIFVPAAATPHSFHVSDFDA